MQNTMLDSTVSSNSQELPNASSALKLFENPQFKVRVIMRCAEPWFVAKDVATCIEHKDVTTMCRVCRDRDMAVINGKEYSADLAEYSESRGNPNLTVISESGLYRILAKCNLPKCEPFENWVFDKVLPIHPKDWRMTSDGSFQMRHCAQTARQPLFQNPVFIR